MPTPMLLPLSTTFASTLCIIDIQMIPSGYVGLHRRGSSHMDDPHSLFIRHHLPYSAHSISFRVEIANRNADHRTGGGLGTAFFQRKESWME